MSEPTDTPQFDNSGFSQDPNQGGQNQGFTPPPPKKGMSTGAKVGIGCGVFAILALLAGCVGLVVVGIAASDDVENAIESVTTVPSEPTADAPATLELYNQVQNGQSLQEVEDIFGGPGQSTSSSDIAGTLFETYNWDGPDYGSALISFQDGKVTSKSQFGLE